MALRCLALGAVLALPQIAGEPSYAAWSQLLQAHYDPARGMDYRGLQRERPALARLQAELAAVDLASLNAKEREAFWINLYNLSTVALIAERYPVKSIRDLSSDPFIRLNVFTRTKARTRLGEISLQDIEDHQLREAFRDPRIHFAINCAARSCPPLRQEAYSGSRLDQQLDDQCRRFFSQPGGFALEQRDSRWILHLSRIMDWFRRDFDGWAGGPVAFLRRYLPREQQQRLDRAGARVQVTFTDYDWSLNEWIR